MLKRKRVRRSIAGRSTPIFSKKPMMQSCQTFAATALLAMVVLTSAGARAQGAAEPPAVCKALPVAPPAQLIASCTGVIENPATPDADRLDAMITRALAFDRSGQNAK